MATQSSEIQATISRACQRLEATVKDMGVRLDMEWAQISTLEEIVVAVKDMNDESALSGVTFMVGAYLGEILRHKMDGRWVATTSGTPSLEVRDQVLFPIDKVRKFAANPGADGLVFMRMH